MKLSFMQNRDETTEGVSTVTENLVESDFQEIKTRLHREVIESLDLSRIGDLSQDGMRQHIRDLAIDLLEETDEHLSVSDEERLIDEMIAESFGLGPLEPYMHDPEISDILVNGSQEVYIERNGLLEETRTVFADDEHLLQVISRIAASVGRRIDEQSPMVDARLPDGSRVNAIIPPLALNGPVLSIRRFGQKPLELAQLIEHGSLSANIVNLLRAAVEGRINIVISGGTGAGKTTLLNCISHFIPLNERLVTIEDSAELQLQRKHVVNLETRQTNIEGTGEISQRDLVRNSLRMRPDRIIVGEVRGGEALDMLQAMNTGHEGSLTTIHANDTDDALSRMEVMVSMAGFDLPASVVRRYIASAVTLLVHVSRLKGGVRRITRVSEITGLQGNEYQIQDLFRFRQTGVNDAGLATGEFLATGNRPHFLARIEDAGVELADGVFATKT